MRHQLALCCFCVTVATWSVAQTTTGMSGVVSDSSGALVAQADITATNIATGQVLHTVSDSSGSYSLAGINAGKYKVVVTKSGFGTLQQVSVPVIAGQVVADNITLQVNSVGTTVEVFAGMGGVTTQPTQEDVFESDQQLRVLDRKQIETAGPVAGSAQIVALTPGANVTGYGNTGATKYTVGVNGVSQGWGGYGGYSGGGALAITFDGVPVVDPATSLWQSPTIPEQFMVQNANVTYGPGDPASRWYNNVGGMVEFTPVQPTLKPHAEVSATYGSFGQKDLAFNLMSGVHHGWSEVLAVGLGQGNDFRSSPDGFNNPSKDMAYFGKVAKTFSNNSFEGGGYYAHSGGYRSQVIPVASNPLITFSGQPGAALYSQQDSGYYSTVPQSSYGKYDTNEMGLVYGRAHIQADPTLALDSLTWFMHIARTHARHIDVYSLGAQEEEFNHPHTDTVGQKLLVTKRLPMNTLTFGGYYINAFYNSRNNFYNTANGGGLNTANIGGKVRSSNFTQNDFALTAQDEFRVGTRLTLTPGVRYVGFSTGYSDVAPLDYALAGGAAFATHCAATGTSFNPNDPTQNINNPGGATISVKDQGSNCGGLENRSGVEPSVNATVRTFPWLQVYGGFMEALRAPQVGGGGGLFQSVDPASYHLSRQTYTQGGFKIHNEGSGALRSMLITGAYYHQNWANQEIDTSLANGDTIAANGTSVYKGFNASFDDDPIARLHLFANMNVETATYTNYTTVPAVGTTTPAQNFNGLHVPYVPSSTVNAGAFYGFKVSHDLSINPMASFQYIGSQYIFNNNGVDSVGNQFPQPSNQKMAGYGTLNLGVSAPYKFLEFKFNAQNLLNKKYLIYEYTSFGSYFGTNPNGLTGQTGPVAGYNMAYPGEPVSVYGGVTAHF